MRHSLKTLKTEPQTGKSLEHLWVQTGLQKIFSSKLVLEKPFPEISRIADCYHEELGLVFEIQCSNISVQEIEQREADYGSLGLKVIWILHEALFGGAKPKAAELRLRVSPHYYTHISEAKEPLVIYDYLGKPWEKSFGFTPLKLPIKIERMQKLSMPSKDALEEILIREAGHPYLSYFEARYWSWPIYFQGDLLSTFLS